MQNSTSQKAHSHKILWPFLQTRTSFKGFRLGRKIWIVQIDIQAEECSALQLLTISKRGLGNEKIFPKSISIIGANYTEAPTSQRMLRPFKITSRYSLIKVLRVHLGFIITIVLLSVSIRNVYTFVIIYTTADNESRWKWHVCMYLYSTK